MVSEASDSRCRKTLKLLRLRGIKVDFDRFRQARSATDYRPKFRPAAAAAADDATSAYDYVTMSKSTGVPRHAGITWLQQQSYLARITAASTHRTVTASILLTL